MTSFYEEIRKSDTVSDEQENAQSRASIDKWIFRLLLFLMGFMPLVVMANVEEVISPLISNIDVLSSGVKGDLFTHYKALLVLIVTIITGVMLLVKVFFMGGTIKKTWLNYVLGVFIVAIVASTVMSPNISTALNGQYNRSDGAISWLCYVALMFIAMNIEYPKNVVNYIMYTMMPFVYINLYIITMNFYGKDLLQNGWMQKLVSLFLPEGANISEGSQLVGTLNQWNYMSGMFAMMTVMYLAWAVTSKKWHENIIGAVTASAAIAVMFMSMSKGGFLTVIVIIPLILFVIIRVDKKNQALISLIIFILISGATFHVLAQKDYRVWMESFGLFTDKIPYLDEDLSFKGNGNIVYASEEILELPVLPEKVISSGSGRIYIWEKSLDLVKNRMILGYGLDTLVYNFPHYNIDARSGIADENISTDKPHNTFVGLLYGVGIIGLIALLIIMGRVVVITVKAIATKSLSTLILSVAILAYFIQSLFNDSLIGISAWLFIMIGIVCTFSLNKQQEEFY